MLITPHGRHFTEETNTAQRKALLWGVNYHSILARIFEAAIHTSSGTAPAHHRTQALCDCLESCLNIIQSFLAIPVADLATGCPLTTMCGLALALLTIRRLLLLRNDPDWDTTIARQTVDYPGLLAKLDQKFEQAYHFYCSPCPEHTLTEMDIVPVTGYDLGNGRDKGDVDATEHESRQGSPSIPAVLGYWRKIKQLKAWYLSDVLLQEEQESNGSGFDVVDVGTLFGFGLTAEQAAPWLVNAAVNDNFSLWASEAGSSSFV